MQEKYSGTEQERFGPTVAAEHLADENGLEVGAEMLRRWMLTEGLWIRLRRRKAYRKRRERRCHFGDLVQMEGSFHAWFEERGARGCLMNMVGCHDADVLSPGGAGNDLGSGRSAAIVDREVCQMLSGQGGPEIGIALPYPLQNVLLEPRWQSTVRWPSA